MTKKLDANYRENESKFNKLEVPTPGVSEAGKVLMVGEDGKLMYDNIEIPSAGLKPHRFSTINEMHNALKDRANDFIFRQLYNPNNQYILRIDVQSSEIRFSVLTVTKSGTYSSPNSYVEIGFVTAVESSTSSRTYIDISGNTTKRIIGSSTDGLTVESMRYNITLDVSTIVFWYED